MDKYSIANQVLNDHWFIRTNIKVSGPYWRYRLFRPFFKLYNRIWRATHQGVPWTSPASIRIFDQILTKEMTGFEYGSGSSTRYFAGLLGTLVSVEHDKSWYEKVKDQLFGITNVSYHLVPIEEDQNVKNFLAYPKFITQFPENHFDFILVDGRERVECCKNSISSLKPGGVLVLDNSEREKYQEIFTILNKWKMIQTTTGLTDTTFWFKPLNPS